MSGKVNAKQGVAITSRKRASLNVAKQKVSPSTRQWPPGTAGDNADLIYPPALPRALPRLCHPANSFVSLVTKIKRNSFATNVSFLRGQFPPQLSRFRRS